MNLLSAIGTVLADQGKPLHYREIAKMVIDRGLWSTGGKTPEATVNSQLAVSIKTQGTASPFQRTARGTFSLREWGLPEIACGNRGADSPSRKRVRAERLSFSDAAEQVLERFGERSPMHYRRIAEKALELGLLDTAGKTPEATLYTMIRTEIQRRDRRGEQPRFVMHGKGYVGLSKWMSKGIAFQIERHNEHVRRRLHDGLRAMPPSEFETLIGTLLGRLGFADVSVTGRSGDGGIDLRGTMVTGDVIRTRMAVQVKRWKANVQAPTVQQVRGSLGTHEQGLIITTSEFSKGACEEAERADATPVGLMNGDQLVKLLVENDIGIRRSGFDLIELADPAEEP